MKLCKYANMEGFCRENYIWKFNINLLWWQWEFRAKGSKLFLLVKQFFFRCSKLVSQYGCITDDQRCTDWNFGICWSQSPTIFCQNLPMIDYQNLILILCWYVMQCYRIPAALHMCTHWCNLLLQHLHNLKSNIRVNLDNIYNCKEL